MTVSDQTGAALPAPSIDLGKAPLNEVLHTLNASADGLTQAEAQSRLNQSGYNELPEEKVNPILKFLAYFWGPIPWMIEAAAALSLFLKHWADFPIILVLLVVNAIVGFWEEYQAGECLAGSSALHPVRRYPARRLWCVHVAYWLEVGRGRVGLRAGLVPDR